LGYGTSFILKWQISVSSAHVAGRVILVCHVRAVTGANIPIMERNDPCEAGNSKGIGSMNMEL
jgi:hypothetical protein